MRRPAVRSQLLRLRDDLGAAHDGRDLLDRKREAIVRALTERVPRRNALARAAAQRLGDARAALDRAELGIGRSAVDAAALAQPPLPPLELQEGAIVGVRVPRVKIAADTFQPQYGPASGSPQLDDAGAAFVAVLRPLADLAAEDTAVRALQAALARTSWRLNALDKELIPDLERQIRTLTAALEEEERDEAVRRRMWLWSKPHTD